MHDMIVCMSLPVCRPCIRHHLYPPSAWTPCYRWPWSSTGGAPGAQIQSWIDNYSCIRGKYDRGKGLFAKIDIILMSGLSSRIYHFTFYF